jgi:uncharacterized protein GlcG (DUF336 family)
MRSALKGGFMYYTLKAAIGIGVAAMLAGPAAGQGVVMQRNLSLGMAKTIAEATLAECRSKGFHTAAAVVDRAGQVLVILRDEEATAQTAEMARRKAYTARMFRLMPVSATSRTSSLLPAEYRSRSEMTSSAAPAVQVPI